MGKGIWREADEGDRREEHKESEEIEFWWWTGDGREAYFQFKICLLKKGKCLLEGLGGIVLYRKKAIL